MKQQRNFEIVTWNCGYGNERIICQLSNTNLREARRFAREHSLYWKYLIAGVREGGTVLAQYEKGKAVQS